MEEITSLEIHRLNTNTWYYLDNTGVLPKSASGNKGYSENDLITLKTENGAIVYHNVPYTAITYIDDTNSSNNFTPTSGLDLIANLKTIGFFDTGSSGGGGATSFLDLTDTPSTYLGNAGKLVIVNPAQTEVEFTEVNFLQNNITVWNEFGDVIDGDGAITSQQVADWLNLQPYSIIINENQTPVYFIFNRAIGGINYKFIYEFTRGKGTWGKANGAVTDVTKWFYATNLKLINADPVTIDDIEGDPNAQIHELGTVNDGDYITVANELATWDFSDSGTGDPGQTISHYFSYIENGVTKLVKFIGTPGIYGIDETQFVEADFSPVTNSDVIAVTQSPFIYPDDYEGTDTEKLQSACNAASGTDKIVFISYRGDGSNVWMIDESVLLDSNTTIWIVNAKLKISDTCRDNIFRTNNCGYQIYDPKDNPRENITILGFGDAILEGADHPRSTGGFKTLSLTSSRESLTSYGTDAGVPGELQVGEWRNNMVIFAYTKNVRVEGIKFKDPHCFVLCFERCTYVTADNIILDAPGDHVIDGVGQFFHNCDGVKIMQGGNNVNFTNIRGHSEDNCITAALLGEGFGNAGPGTYDSMLVTGDEYDPETDDIYDVYWNNIQAWSYQSIARILNTNGAKIYNIQISNIYDTSVASELTHEILGGAIQFGSFSPTYGGLTPLGSCSNINIENIVSKNMRYGLKIDGSLAESTISNVTKYVDNAYPAIYIHPSSTGTRNVQVTNIYDRGQEILVSGVLNEYEYSGFKQIITPSGTSKKQIILTGTSGTANINVDGTDYLATFSTNLSVTSNNFTSTHAATILSAHGVTVTSSGGSQVLTFEHTTTGFPDITITNVSGNLAGNSSEVFPVTTTSTTFEDKNEVGLNYPESSTYAYDDKTLIPKEYVDDAIAGVESSIPTVDSIPTDGSANAVSSNGVFDELALKAPSASPVFTTAVTFPVAMTITGGNSNNYVRGDGVPQNFAASVRANVLLTGLSTSNVILSATDSVLAAFGKLQGQLNSITKTINSSSTSVVLLAGDISAKFMYYKYNEGSAGAVEIPAAGVYDGQTLCFMNVDNFTLTINIAGAANKIYRLGAVSNTISCPDQSNIRLIWNADEDFWIYDE